MLKPNSKFQALKNRPLKPVLSFCRDYLSFELKQILASPNIWRRSTNICIWITHVNNTSAWVVSFKFVSYFQNTFHVSNSGLIGCFYIILLGPDQYLGPCQSCKIKLFAVTMWKVSVFGVFLLRVFLHIDQKNSEYRYFSRRSIFTKCSIFYVWQDSKNSMGSTIT